MIKKDERHLLLAIKIIPPVLFSILAIIGTIIALYLNEINFQKEITTAETEYLKNEKQIIKNEVIKIHDNIKNEKELTEKKLQYNIKEKVYSAYSIVNNIYKQNKQSKSKKEILKMTKDALRDIRFNEGRGYFFIYNIDGTNILLPPRQDLEGKNLINLKDAKGAFTIRDMKDLVLKNNESFYSWWWYKPNEKNFQSKKIGFVKYFAPLDCFIGTGEYVEDFEEIIKKSISERLSLYKFGKEAYIFVFNKDGNLVVHNNKDIIGKKSLVFRKVQERKNLKIELPKDEQGGYFLRYRYSKLSNEKQVDKISYVLKFKDWDWSIGAGFYTDDLNTLIEYRKNELSLENEVNIQNIIIISIVLLIVIVLISFLISYAIEQRFESYKRKAKEQDQLLLEQSKMAAMGEMIENIAHQWRQPLSVISSVSSGLKVQQEYGEVPRELLSQRLENITESVEYLSQTIDDFRNFYKTDTIKKDFNISLSIQKAADLLYSKFRKKNIELKIEKSELNVLGLENELVQVFMNILNNARDVLETLDIDKKLIFVKITKVEENIKISFYDNGDGISQEIISKIFDRKFTTKEKQNGTGIGLYMSKLIVEKNGGTLSVQNKSFDYDGKRYNGAEFIITLKS